MPDNEPRRAGLVFDSRCKNHITGPGHPERPERVDAIQKALESAKLLPRLTDVKPRLCDDAEILYCHTEGYLNTVKRDIEENRGTLSTGDTSICPESLTIARLAAGGILSAVDAVMSDKVDHVFSALRPPGHHACPAKGMGFCLISNVAIAARYAQRKHGIGKVLIADWDVHHGNGTQDVFYEDDSVFFFSTHQSPWYPGTGHKEETGKGRGLGTTLNQPLPAGSGHKRIVDQAFADRLVAAADKFRPELVFISAGFDSRQDDPLGDFQLTDDDFAQLTRIMLRIADEHAGGKLVSVLEGGYNLAGLGLAAAAHVEALLGIP